MAKATKESITLDMRYEKDTKNKVRYKEQNDPETVGILYVTKKGAEELGNPKKLEVEIRAVG